MGLQAIAYKPKTESVGRPTDVVSGALQFFYTSV